jgi:hypothetical protein
VNDERVEEESEEFMKNKKRVIASIVIFALVIFSAVVVAVAHVPMSVATKPNIQDSSGIPVNPIDGLSLVHHGRRRLILRQIEISGGKYFVSNVEEDA